VAGGDDDAHATLSNHALDAVLPRQNLAFAHAFSESNANARRYEGKIMRPFGCGWIFRTIMDLRHAGANDADQSRTSQCVTRTSVGAL
jgi:hypothetical protein